MEFEELLDRVKQAQLTRRRGGYLDLSNEDLASEQLKELIPEIKKIQNLELNLNGNINLRVLPEEIKELTNLKGLLVDNCGLSSLPSKIKELPNIEVLDLSNNDFKVFPKEICELSKIKHLFLSHNKIDSLPKEIKDLSSINSIVLDNNKFEVFPKEICGLSALTKIDISNNKIKKLPIELGELNTLSELNLSENKLESLPELLLNNSILQENLEVDIVDNPNLPEDFQRILVDNFERQQFIDLDLQSQPKGTSVLERIYGENAEKVIEKINALELDKVYVGEDNDKEDQDEAIEFTHPGKVMLDLVSKIPFIGVSASEIYLPAVKKLTDDVLNDELSKEERQAIVEKVAVSLGNCATPVQSFLKQVAIGEKLNSGKELPELFKGLIVAEGFEDLFKKEFKEELKNNVESTELLAGLTNLVFLEDAESYKNYPFKVKGDVVGLPSISQQTNFGFALINGNQEIEDKFVKLCCKTDENGKGVKEEDGSYTIAPEKYNAISEKKFAELGVISEREKKVNTFEKEMQNMLAEHDLTSHYDKDDVVPFLDVGRLKNELRIELQATPDKAIDAIVSERTKTNGEAIGKLGEKYQEKRHDMSLMSKPTIKPIERKKPKKGFAQLLKKVMPKKISPSL